MKNIKGKLNIIVFIIGMGLFASCNTNRLKITIPQKNLNIKIQRFDEELYRANLDSLSQTINILQEKYPQFFTLFNLGIIKIGSVNQYNYEANFIRFLTDYTVSEIINEVHEKFETVNDIESKLNSAFNYYKYYLPEKRIPELLSFTAGYNQSIVIDSNLLAIGFDKYLGADDELYSYLGIPKYKRKNLSPTMIVPDCMRAIALTEYEYNDSVNNLISNMIYQGKVLYFVDAMMPFEKDNIKIGYTENELEWCQNNEKEMWAYFIENKLLFSTEYEQIKRYIDDSPFTATFSQNSPGRTGIWIGWQIVRSYMNNNQEINLIGLMKNDNYQKILNLSKYKP